MKNSSNRKIHMFVLIAAGVLTAITVFQKTLQADVMSDAGMTIYVPPPPPFPGGGIGFGVPAGAGIPGGFEIPIDPAEPWPASCVSRDLPVGVPIFSSYSILRPEWRTQLTCRSDQPMLVDERFAGLCEFGVDHPARMGVQDELYRQLENLRRLCYLLGVDSHVSDFWVWLPEITHMSLIPGMVECSPVVQYEITCSTSIRTFSTSTDGEDASI